MHTTKRHTNEALLRAEFRITASENRAFAGFKDKGEITPRLLFFSFLLSEKKRLTGSSRIVVLRIVRVKECHFNHAEEDDPRNVVLSEGKGGVLSKDQKTRFSKLVSSKPECEGFLSNNTQ